MNIVQHFFQIAEKHPNRVAIATGKRLWTFEQFAHLIRQKVAALEQKGYGNNDNLIVMIPVSVELYATILAIFYLGGRVVLVDQIFPKSRVAYAYGKAECKGIITLPLFSWTRWLFFSWSLFQKVFSLGKSAQTQRDISNKTPDETALLTFTSGTTGNPKSANRTHGFLDIQLQTIIAKTGLQLGDVHLSSFPVVTMCNLAVGATSILPPKPGQKAAWAFLQRFCPITVVSASVEHFNTYLPNIQQPHTLRKVVLGGSTLLPDFVKTVAQKIEPARIELVYGSTEAEPIATLTAQEYLEQYRVEEKGVVVGNPHPNISVKIIQMDGEQWQEMPEGHIGEIMVAGPHVLASYYKDEQAFRENKLLINGTVWHRTGDAGYMRQSMLYYFGRMSLAWKEAGEWVSPLTCEKWCADNQLPPVATWLRLHDQNVLFFCGNDADYQRFNTVFPFPVHRTVRLSGLPKDKRHQSRIDYGLLKKELG
ncbi:MAG: AMP-binding protein [Chitinophagales bacterium]|nr:AMP-binding protein [Chitinophagales bacterium]